MRKPCTRNQKQSEAIRRTEKQSEAIRSNHLRRGAKHEEAVHRDDVYVGGAVLEKRRAVCPRAHLRSNQKQSEAIRSNQKQSEEITGVPTGAPCSTVAP